MTIIEQNAPLSRHLRRFHRVAALAVLSLAILPGCDTELPDDSDLEFRTSVGDGGPIFNTNVIDTSDVAQIDTFGDVLDGVTLVGVEIIVGGAKTWIDKNTLFIDDGTVTATVGGIAYAGEDFIGSQWSFEVNGVNVSMTLTTVEASSAAGLYSPSYGAKILMLDPDRLVYTFTYDVGDQVLIETCDIDSDGGARAVLYGDIYVDHVTGKISDRSNTVYFGCISGAVGKAALHGYAPDNPSLPNVSLEDFQLAVRALRADYCGSGYSYTEPGKQLTYEDRYSINSHDVAAFVTEAMWEPGVGAACVNKIRRKGQLLPFGLLCADGHVVPPCGPEVGIENQWGAGHGMFWTKIP